MPTLQTIARNASWEIEIEPFRKKTETGVMTAVNGESFTGWLSATDGGDPIVGADVVTLNERSAQAGTYYGILTKAQVALDLAGIVDGGTVYEVTSETDGSRASRPLVVVKSARMRVA